MTDLSLPLDLESLLGDGDEICQLVCTHVSTVLSRTKRTTIYMPTRPPCNVSVRACVRACENHTKNECASNTTAKKYHKVPNLECFCVGITRSGGTIVSGWSDGKIRAFYPESGKLKFVISDAHAEGATAVALAHDDDTRPPWR